MPLARIDLIKGKSDAYRQTIGKVVYESLKAIGVPENDRFQVIYEHDKANFIFAKSYLDIAHTEDLVMIQITFNEGRTTAQKQTLFKVIADGIHAATGLGINDVFINLVEVKRENWSFGNGIAQYATTDQDSCEGCGPRYAISSDPGTNERGVHLKIFAETIDS